MSPGTLEQLRARSLTIAERWEILMRMERVTSPLANPDALVHLIPGTLHEIISLLAKQSRLAVSSPPERIQLPDARCGCNPYHAFFVAAEQALSEAVVLIQAEQPADQRRPADVSEMITTLRRRAVAEMDAFCGVCSHRGTMRQCRMPGPARETAAVLRGSAGAPASACG